MILGLVGHGRWGRNIERTLLTFPDVSVAVIAKGEKPRGGLDGVLIATQSAIHAEAAIPYIERRIPTFIEKPMATTLADAERIREAAERSGGEGRWPIQLGLHVLARARAYVHARRDRQPHPAMVLGRALGL